MVKFFTKFFAKFEIEKFEIQNNHNSGKRLEPIYP